MIRRTLALAGAAALTVGFTGLAEPAAADPGVDAQVGDVIISEVGIVLDPNVSGGIEDTFIELHNVSGGNVDVSGWDLNGCNTTDDFLLATIPINTTIPAGDKYLVGSADYAGGPAPDLDPFVSPAFLELDGGGAELVDGTTLMGDVQWEDSHTNCSLFDPAVVTPTSAESLNYNVSTGAWFLNDPTPENSSS